MSFSTDTTRCSVSFSDQAKRDGFTAALDLSHPDAAMQALTLFDQWWAHIRFNTYVSSISEHDDREDSHGRLSMWRTFGGTLPKVALVFRIPGYSGATEKLNLMFSPVAYLNHDDLHATINVIIENIKASSELLSTLDRL